MAFEMTTVQYTGKINEVVLGAAQTLTVGGETSYPFLKFEGEMPHKPKIAMEIWDMDPGDQWPDDRARRGMAAQLGFSDGGRAALSCAA